MTTLTGEAIGPLFYALAVVGMALMALGAVLRKH